MSEKRFKVCIDSNNGVGLFDNSVKLLFVKFTNKEDALSCKDSLKHHCNLMNELHNENEQLKKSEKINMEYAEQIVEENQKLRIAKNDLRIENEQLRKQIQNYEQLISNSMSKKQCCLFEEESFDKYLTELLNEKEEIIKEQERRIIVLENLLTNIGVKWVDDDK